MKIGSGKGGLQSSLRTAANALWRPKDVAHVTYATAFSHAVTARIGGDLAYGVALSGRPAQHSQSRAHSRNRERQPIASAPAMRTRVRLY